MMKRFVHRGTSLLLCVMLLLQMVPVMSVHTHAADGDTPCAHTNVSEVAGVAATCMDQGLAPCWRCTDCSALFLDAECTTAISEVTEADKLPATGHNFVDGKCTYCDSTDWLYSPITSMAQLDGLGEDAMYMLVAVAGDTWYTMGMPPAEMGEVYPGIANDLVTITPQADGTISANDLNAAQFQLVAAGDQDHDYGYAIKLPNYWLFGSLGGGAPWVQDAEYPTSDLPELSKTGGWKLEFYDPDAMFTGGTAEMTYAQYLQEQNPALAQNLQKGSVFVYNSNGNVAAAMRLRDYTNANGQMIGIVTDAHGTEEGATDYQYPLYLYAAFDHAHVMSETQQEIDEYTHGIVCTVEGCTFAESQQAHTQPDLWTYVDESVHGAACADCGRQMTQQHRASWKDNQDGTHSFTCSICNPQLEPQTHTWGEWSYNLDMETHERMCTSCYAVESSETHIWSEPETVEPPSCDTTGMAQRHCTVTGCETVMDEELPATGHNWVADGNEWYDCTVGGVENYRCAADGCGLTREVEIPAGDHNWSQWKYLEEPTQLKGGIEYRYCLNGCEIKETRGCAPYGHVHTLQKEEGYPATCCGNGVKTYYFCQYTAQDDGGDEAEYNDSCGLMFLDEEGLQQVTENELIIPATGVHTLGEWVVSEEQSPNLPETVFYQRRCLVEGCGYVEYNRESVEGHVHEMIAVEAVEASCAAPGHVAYFLCVNCDCMYEDEAGSKPIIEDSTELLPRLSHVFGEWTMADTFEGHSRTCQLCGYTVASQHLDDLLPGTEENCGHSCRICGHQSSYNGHVFTDYYPCDDRWQHKQNCQYCGYTLIEDHEFGDWIYGYYESSEGMGPDGKPVLVQTRGHYRTCGCGAMETSLEHIWDSGEETRHGYKTYQCVTYTDCGGTREEFLRCMHTCFTCGKCTAAGTCPGMERCTCETPETLVLQEPAVIINRRDDPQQTYLADILLKKADAPLDPDAAPDQQVPEEYADYTVGIQEIPLDINDSNSPLSNPYTQYVLQSLEGYDPRYLFDIHLLDGQGMITRANGSAQYLIRLYLKPEIVMDLRNGLLRLAHVTENGQVFYGVGEDCVPFYVLEGTRAWFWADSFSPFALVEPQAPYYGREALGKMENKDALLYAYDQLVAGIDAAAEVIQIYPQGGISLVSIEEIQMVMDAYTRDHTENFWLNSKYSISYKKSSGMASSIKPSYNMTGQELTDARAKFEARVDELLDGISSQQSEFDRQLILHDRLAGIVTYDETLSQEHIYDAYGAIVNGLAVCQGYAEALQYLLRRAGIQSFIVTGYSQDQSHAWNMVRIGGKYYHTDLTWDDQGERLYHAYFNMSDGYISEDHAIYVTAYPMDTCEGMEYNYFKVNQIDLNDSEAKDTASVAQKIKINGNRASFLVTGTTSAQQFRDWFEDHKTGVLNQAGLSGAQVERYTCMGRETMITFSGVPVHTCGSGTMIAGKAFTCTEDGWKDYYRCSCGKLYADAACEKAIDDLAHWKTGDGKAAAAHSYGTLVPALPEQHTTTTLTAGVAAYYHCSACSRYFTEGKVETTLEALTGPVPVHSYGSWITTDADSHWKQCTCGLKTEQAAHLYDGDADAHCNTCGHVRQVTILPPEGLSGAVVDTVAGTLTLTIANGTAVSGKVMVVVYDNGGRMLGIRYVDETVTIDSTGKTYTVVYDKNGTPRQVKAFLVNTQFAPVLTIAPLQLP